MEGLGGRGTVDSVKSTKLHDGQRIEEREREMSGEGVTHSGEAGVREGLVSSLISFYFL